MSARLKDKVAIITGAGSSGPGWGNGKATAVLYAREGAKVFAVDIRQEAADETVAIIKGEGGEAGSFAADVSKSAEVRALVERCHKIFGRVDVLHNNVGVLAVGGPEELSEEIWDRHMAINVKGVFLACKYALPIMVQQGQGAIVNTSSIASIRYTGYPSAVYRVQRRGEPTDPKHRRAVCPQGYTRQLRAPGIDEHSHDSRATEGYVWCRRRRRNDPSTGCAGPMGRMGDA
jgi:NAD(P)-dependent dehydrogenase (short-subunit alcohol dehydrogenase family)